MTAVCPHLPTGDELANLYSRSQVRALLGWSDDKLRRRLGKLPAAAQPSGSGRGQQFTGAQVRLIYEGGFDCRPDGSKRSPRANGAAATAGTSAGKTCTVAQFKGGSRQRSRLQQLLSEPPEKPSSDRTVIPLQRP